MRFLRSFCIIWLFLLIFDSEQFPQSALEGPLWVTSDFHLHNIPVETPQELVNKIVSLNINVGDALVWGNNITRSAQWFRGQQDDPTSRPKHILHWDIEISFLPGFLNGHMIMLNVADPNAITPTGVGYPGQDYLLPNYDYVQIPGGILGYTHSQNWPLGSYGYPDKENNEPKELPLDIALKRVDFLGTENVASGSSFYWLWYQMLDAGFHLTPIAGSDYPFRPVGSLHTAVLLEPGRPLSFQNYIAAVRKGRTVVKNRRPEGADFLDLQVNGAALGSEINVPAGTTNVTATVTTQSPISREVEIVVNGTVVRRMPVSASRQTRTFPLAITKSSWIAARTVQIASPPLYQAHTAATFVLVDGNPIRNDPVAATNWMNYLEQYYLYGTTEIAGEGGRTVFGNSTPLVRQSVNQAKAVWQQIALEGMRAQNGGR